MLIRLLHLLFFLLQLNVPISLLCKRLVAIVDEKLVLLRRRWLLLLLSVAIDLHLIIGCGHLLTSALLRFASFGARLLPLLFFFL